MKAPLRWPWLFVALAACAPTASSRSNGAAAPVTRASRDEADDYAWLEDGERAEVKAFDDAQRVLARSILDALPERAAVRARAASIFGAASADWLDVQLQGGRLFALKSAPPKARPILVDLGPITASRVPDATRERVVVDPNAIDPSGETTIDFFAPSPDGRIVAVSLSKDGSEIGDVHLFDVATGGERRETIARAGAPGGSVVWNADGSGLYYTRSPRDDERSPADRDLDPQVWFHALGAPGSADAYAGGEDLPRFAKTSLVRSDDGKRILALVSNGDGGPIELRVRDGGRWLRLSRFEDELSTAALGPDGKVYAVSRKGAPRGKIVAFAPPLDRASAADVLPEGDALVEDVIVTSGALYVVEAADGASRMRRFPLGAKPEPLARELRPSTVPKKNKKDKNVKLNKKDNQTKSIKSEKRPPPPTIALGARGYAAAVLPLPPMPSVRAVRRIGEDLLVRTASLLDAPRWLLYRASEHRFVATPLATKAAYGASDVEVVREVCVSSDGRRGPMSVLRKRGAKLDGAMPAYLTGDGGAGVALEPRMRATYRIWLDSGGVVAVASARRGEAWERARDLAACGRALVDLGYTKPERLALGGRADGDALVSAALAQPSMFRAVAAGAGIYDMLRAGLGKDEAEFRARYASSPFYNVEDGAAYPAVLFLMGANDPYSSRKMAARLQAATSSERPILLRVSEGASHGVDAPLTAEIDEVTDVLTFLLHEVGASVPASM